MGAGAFSITLMARSYFAILGHRARDPAKVKIVLQISELHNITVAPDDDPRQAAGEQHQVVAHQPGVPLLGAETEASLVIDHRGGSVSPGGWT